MKATFIPSSKKKPAAWLQRFLLVVVFFIASHYSCYSNYASLPFSNKLNTSTKQQALDFIAKTDFTGEGSQWPNIDRQLFISNLRGNIENPLSIYPGEGTYFCAYSALTYLLLQDDPLGYATFSTELYTKGKAVYRGVIYEPSESIRKEAGLMKYKGIMDIHPADQMWFLTLAGRYKGYLNIFNRTYDSGDENSFWASVNYAKFNRMAKKLLNYDVKAKGTDFFRPRVKDLYDYLTKKMSEGNVVLYINNRIVHKKNHTNLKLAVPTHYIALENISKEHDVITLIYWDNGGKTLIQLSPRFLKRIIYGITVFTKNNADAE